MKPSRTIYFQLTSTYLKQGTSLTKNASYLPQSPRILIWTMRNFDASTDTIRRLPFTNDSDGSERCCESSSLIGSFILSFLLFIFEMVDQ